MLAGVPLPAGFSISCRLESFSAVGVCKSRTLILAVVHYFLHHSSPSAIFLLCLSVCYIISSYVTTHYNASSTIHSAFILLLVSNPLQYMIHHSYRCHLNIFNIIFILHVNFTVLMSKPSPLSYHPN